MLIAIDFEWERDKRWDDEVWLLTCRHASFSKNDAFRDIATLYPSRWIVYEGEVQIGVGCCRSIPDGKRRVENFFKRRGLWVKPPPPLSPLDSLQMLAEDMMTRFKC